MDISYKTDGQTAIHYQIMVLPYNVLHKFSLPLNLSKVCGTELDLIGII